MITWTAFFFIITNMNADVMKGFATEAACLSRVDETFERNVNVGVEPELMVGWCVKEIPTTLEFKGEADEGPVTLD